MSILSENFFSQARIKIFKRAVTMFKVFFRSSEPSTLRWKKNWGQWTKTREKKFERRRRGVKNMGFLTPPLS